MTHCQNIGRAVHLVNLDPAAEKFEYEPSIGTVRKTNKLRNGKEEPCCIWIKEN